MHASPDQTADEEVVNAYRAHLHAMSEGDTDALDRMLDDGFTLTHITGYEQPKGEWLAQMQAGQFVYHDIADRNVSVEVTGNTIRLVGRIVTDATVYGSRANWRLQLTMDYTRTGNSWKALRSVATIW